MGGIQCQIDICGVRTGHLAEHFTGNRRNVVEIIARYRRHPLATDKIFVMALVGVFHIDAEILQLSQIHGGLRKLWTGVLDRACKPKDATSDRKSTRLNSSHVKISYAVFCLKK